MYFWPSRRQLGNLTYLLVRPKITRDSESPTSHPSLGNFLLTAVKSSCYGNFNSEFSVTCHYYCCMGFSFDYFYSSCFCIRQ